MGIINRDKIMDARIGTTRNKIFTLSTDTDRIYMILVPIDRSLRSALKLIETKRTQNFISIGT